MEVQGLKLLQLKGTESALPSNLFGGSVSCCIVIKHCSISFGFPSLPVREEWSGCTGLCSRAHAQQIYPREHLNVLPAVTASTVSSPPVSCCLLWNCCHKYCKYWETLMPLNWGVWAVLCCCSQSAKLLLPLDQSFWQECGFSAQAGSCPLIILGF